MHAADELRRAFEAAGSVFCVAARQMTAAATHLQKPLLGDVPKCPLVSMECGGRRRSCHDGRIPSTQALCEPATIVASDVADGAHRQHPSVPGLPCQPPKESNQQQNRRSKLDYIYAPGEPGLLLFPVLVQPSLPYALIKRRILIGSGYFVGGCGRLVYGRLVYGQFHSGKHLKPSFGKHPQYPLSESHG